MSEYFVSYDPTFKFVASFSSVYYTTISVDGYFAACAFEDYVYTCNILNGDLDDFVTNHMSTATQLPLIDDVLAYVTFNKSFNQVKYDIQTSVIYTGTAKIGVLTSDQNWTIKKMSLDSDGNPTSQQTTKIAGAIWDNRENETYY